MVFSLNSCFRLFLCMNYTHFKYSLCLSMELWIGQQWKTFPVSLCNLHSNCCCFPTVSAGWSSLKNKWAIMKCCMLLLKWQEVIQLMPNYACVTCDGFCSRAFSLCTVKGICPTAQECPIVIDRNAHTWFITVNLGKKKKIYIYMATCCDCVLHQIGWV